MKTKFVLLFAVAFLTFGLRADAVSVDDMLLKLNAIQKEVNLLKSMLGATVWANSINVTYPNGGEVFTFGQDVNIKWNTSGIAADAVLNIAIDNIATTGVDNIALTTSLNTGSKTIKLPASVAVRDHGDKYVVYIWQGDFYSASLISDSSNASFTMNAGPTAPVALSDLKAGLVEISTPDPILPNTKVYFNSEIRNIADGIPLSGFYNHFEISNGPDGSGIITNVTTNTTNINSGNGVDKIYASYTPTVAGNYSVRACADQSSITNTKGVITEISETNNCSYWKNIAVGTGTTITAPAPMIANYVAPKVADYTSMYGNPVSVTATTASVGGIVTSPGSQSVTERGACYGLTSSPTKCIQASVVQGASDMFLTNISGLTPDTTYYYRIYAKNSKETVYSPSYAIKTLANKVACIIDKPGCPGGAVVVDKTDANGCAISYKCVPLVTTSPEITLISPNKGTYTDGDKVEIKWSTVGVTSSNSNISIELWSEKGGYGIVNTTPNDGSEFVSLSRVADTSNYKVIVKLHYDQYGLKSDQSDDYITLNKKSIDCPLGFPTPSMCPKSSVIADKRDANGCVISYKCSEIIKADPAITLISPNKGTYTDGDKVEIKWSTVGVTSSNSNISIELWSEKGGYGIVNTTPNDGSEFVSLSRVADTSNYKVIVKLHYDQYGLKSDQSDDYITLNKKSSNCLSDKKPTLISCPDGTIAPIMDANGCVSEYNCVKAVSDKTLVKVSNEIDANKIGQVISMCTGGPLQVGSRGERVSALQSFLGMKAEGVFGKKTFLAVKKWQVENGVDSVGIFGRASCLKALSLVK